MKKIITYSFLLFCSLPLFSWPGGTSGTNGPGMNSQSGTTTSTNNDLVPVDGGIISITALTIGYGVRQARKRKEDKNNENGAL